MARKAGKERERGGKGCCSKKTFVLCTFRARVQILPHTLVTMLPTHTLVTSYRSSRVRSAGSGSLSLLPWRGGSPSARLGIAWSVRQYQLSPRLALSALVCLLSPAGAAVRAAGGGWAACLSPSSVRVAFLCPRPCSSSVGGGSGKLSAELASGPAAVGGGSGVGGRRPSVSAPGAVAVGSGGVGAVLGGGCSSSLFRRRLDWESLGPSRQYQLSPCLALSASTLAAPASAPLWTFCKLSSPACSER